MPSFRMPDRVRRPLWAMYLALTSSTVLLFSGCARSGPDVRVLSTSIVVPGSDATVPRADLASQPTPTPLPVPHWQVGDRRLLESVKETTLTTSRGTVPVRSRTRINLEVKEASEDGFLVIWKFGSYQFDEPYRGLDFDPLRADPTSGTFVQVELDRYGRVIDFRNLEDVRRSIEASLNGPMAYYEWISQIIPADRAAEHPEIQKSLQVSQTMAAGEVSEALIKDFLYRLIFIYHGLDVDGVERSEDQDTGWPISLRYSEKSASGGIRLTQIRDVTP